MKTGKILTFLAVLVLSCLVLAVRTQDDTRPGILAISPVPASEAEESGKVLGKTVAGSGDRINASIPGVYVEEIGNGSVSIEPVSTDVAGFLGKTLKGPSEPQPVTSYQEFVNIFGEDPQSYLTYSVRGFFENGGRKVFVARIIPTQTPTAGLKLGGLFINRSAVPVAVLSDYLGNKDINAGPVTGLYALGLIDEISLLYAPDAQRVSGLSQAMIDQCEALKDRMVIMDSPLNNALPEPLEQYNSTFAAYYAPWLQITDLAGNSKLVPPGGFVAGIYVRTDLARGVHKAPANEAVMGITGLERTIGSSERDEMSTNRVNPIISLTGRGILVYGARTLSDDAEYKYVNLRRYTNFLRESIEKSMGWASFEPWSPVLKSKIESCVKSFLSAEWQKGALLGAKPEQAYFVQAVKTTVLKDGVYKQVIYIETGAALLRPAEFSIVKVAVASAE